MMRKATSWAGLLLAVSAALSTPAAAGPPDPTNSTCTFTITQFPIRPNCINNFTPPVVRLCPQGAAPVYDTVTADLTIMDATPLPLGGVVLSFVELAGGVNIATGGATTATTGVAGTGSITLSRGSGCGRVGICADSVIICEIQIRSPDIANTALPAGCVVPTAGTSFVNSNDKSNAVCGFNAHFGPVTTGVNDCWDLNCDNFVSSFDTSGQFIAGVGVAGGWLQHFGHSGVLGPKSTCP